ncbi:MAG: hypothetical protein ACPF9D_11200, partial [Owenweeksia sp.]
MGQLIMRTFFFCVMVFCTLFSSAQQLRGWVIDDEEKVPISNVHVINKRTLKGTLSDDEGRFSIKLDWGDTIVFSN